MSNHTFSFNKQLNLGNDGEASFQKYYADLFPKKSEDRRADFILADGSKVELKTDSYRVSKTPNFFMEMFGSVEEGKLGGPWRAMQDEVQHFVYYYSNDGEFYWFDTVTLCSSLDKIISQGKSMSKDIKNKGWVSRGYLIPREELTHILVKRDKF